MANRITFITENNQTRATFDYDNLTDIQTDSIKKALGITPSGKIDIINTSTYDVTNYATAQIVDANLTAGNIKKNITILGIEGSYEGGGGVTPTGNQDISTLNEYDVTTKATARVSAAERAKIIPQNIANGITILGIEGTHQGGGTPTGNINITTTERVNVADYETAQVVDADLIPQNIRKNINILGIVGSYEGSGGVTPTGSINITTNGTYDVTEYASAVVAIPSAEGYSITTNLTGGTSSGSTATFGSPNTAQVTLTASSGYALPTSVSVTGADSYYNNSTGVVTLTNATGDITITAVFRKSYTITGNITNGSLSGATAIIENNSAYVYLNPSENYYTPTAISVAGASYSYNYNSGQIYLSNPTENVEINATCIEPYTITGNITNGTMSGDSIILDGRTASVTVAPNSNYGTPNSVSVANADFTYNASTGVVSLSNPYGNVTITASCTEVYSITGNITNGSLTGATNIIEGRTASVTVTPNSSFVTPDSVTVANANYTYDIDTGVISLSNPVGNVTITAACVGTYSITGNITNGSLTGDGIIGEGRTATVTIVGSSGYTAPEESAVTVTNATIASYSGGKLTLSNPTGNVTVTATCVEAIVNKGDIINIDMTGSGTPQQYRVIKSVTSNIVEVFSMADVNSTINFNYNNTNTYANQTLDYYLNSTWYDTLSSTAKNALVAKTFTQDSWYWGTSGNPDYQCTGRSSYQVSLGNAAFGNQITRNVYALSIQDIIDYLGVTPEMTSENTTFTGSNIWQMFWNDTYTYNENLWLRSAKADNSSNAFTAGSYSGAIGYYSANENLRARAAFQIDLSKISWSK